MLNISGAFKNRTIGFYLGLAFAALALIVAIVYIAVAASDRTFSSIGFAFLLVGALSEVLVVFTDFKFAPLVPTVLISVGMGFSLVACLPTLMDVVNGINFFGGNLAIAYAVPIALLVSVIAGCVSAFMDMRRS